ncbi:SMP-30/gluconolactonase/LRE family protein [Rhodobacterales bacterium HKCCE2091]|nr:SMP-30/gluconolactonase/LRE family protein [Rhodobacterales bacterium HKCCE2091]
MEFDVVAEGLGFPEGPIWMHDGSILLVEIERRTLTRVWPDGRTEVVAALGGGPNGAAIGPDRRVYVCNNGGSRFQPSDDGYNRVVGLADDYSGGSIQRVDLDSGAIETLYTECNGRALSRPNDLVFDRFGGFWFTDLGKRTEDFVELGAIYYARADGSRITRILDGMFTPNGIGLSGTGDELYVAETRTGRLWAFTVIAPGVIQEPVGPAPGRLLATLPDYQLMDSLAVLEDGRICVATLVSGGISVIDPLGTGVEFVDVPGERYVTNICFGGSDMTDAWITGAGRGTLVHTRWPVPGLRLEFELLK